MKLNKTKTPIILATVVLGGLVLSGCEASASTVAAVTKDLNVVYTESITTDGVDSEEETTPDEYCESLFTESLDTKPTFKNAKMTSTLLDGGKKINCQYQAKITRDQAKDVGITLAQKSDFFKNTLTASLNVEKAVKGSNILTNFINQTEDYISTGGDLAGNLVNKKTKDTDKAKEETSSDTEPTTSAGPSKEGTTADGSEEPSEEQSEDDTDEGEPDFWFSVGLQMPNTVSSKSAIPETLKVGDSKLKIGQSSLKNGVSVTVPLTSKVSADDTIKALKDFPDVSLQTEKTAAAFGLTTVAVGFFAVAFLFLGGFLVVHKNSKKRRSTEKLRQAALQAETPITNNFTEGWNGFKNDMLAEQHHNSLKRRR